MVAGKSVVVTGSTSGIGLGIATSFAAAGANITLNGLGDAAQIEAIRTELAATHGVRFCGSVRIHGLVHRTSSLLRGKLRVHQ